MKANGIKDQDGKEINGGGRGNMYGMFDMGIFRRC